MIESTMANHELIMNAIEKFLCLNSVQYTDVIQYDKDNLGFDVAIVEESENGTEYTDVFIHNYQLEKYL